LLLICSILDYTMLFIFFCKFVEKGKLLGGISVIKMNTNCRIAFVLNI